MRAYRLRRHCDLSLNAFVLDFVDDGIGHAFTELIEMHDWLTEQFGPMGERWRMFASKIGPFATEIHFPQRHDAAAFKLRWY